MGKFWFEIFPHAAVVHNLVRKLKMGSVARVLDSPCENIVPVQSIEYSIVLYTVYSMVEKLFLQTGGV